MVIEIMLGSIFILAVEVAVAAIEAVPVHIAKPTIKSVAMLRTFAFIPIYKLIDPLTDLLCLDSASAGVQESLGKNDNYLIKTNSIRYLNDGVGY